MQSNSIHAFVFYSLCNEHLNELIVHLLRVSPLDEHRNVLLRVVKFFGAV